MFTGKDGNVAWTKYNDYLIFRMRYVTNEEVRSEVPLKHGFEQFIIVRVQML